MSVRKFFIVTELTIHVSGLSFAYREKNQKKVVKLMFAIFPNDVRRPII